MKKYAFVLVLETRREPEGPIYVILFECEIIIQDFIFLAFNILAKKAKIKYPPK
jgi:hypothetical protein